jgi:hypothetical protein
MLQDTSSRGSVVHSSRNSSTGAEGLPICRCDAGVTIQSVKCQTAKLGPELTTLFLSCEQPKHPKQPKHKA